jgi:cytochrome b6-f complex iron-sulfur subunit
MATRREFLQTCAGGLGALSLVDLACGYGGKTTAPEPQPASGTFDLDLTAHPALAADNAAITVSGTPAGTIFVTHTTGTSYFALSRICTHQGCTVDLPTSGSPGILPCPCHGSRYDLNGTVAQGPAPRALQSWTVTRDNNVLTIHFS